MINVPARTKESIKWHTHNEFDLLLHRECIFGSTVLPLTTCLELLNEDILNAAINQGRFSFSWNISYKNDKVCSLFVCTLWDTDAGGIKHDKDLIWTSRFIISVNKSMYIYENRYIQTNNFSNINHHQSMFRQFA